MFALNTSLFIYNQTDIQYTVRNVDAVHLRKIRNIGEILYVPTSTRRAFLKLNIIKTFQIYEVAPSTNRKAINKIHGFSIRINALQIIYRLN